jgi:hypothetical protein
VKVVFEAKLAKLRYFSEWTVDDSNPGHITTLQFKSQGSLFPLFGV